MIALLRGILLGALGFVAMELVSYATHRWVMHGIGMVWHRSHHRAASSGWEANDLFPLVFSAIGVLAFALATVGPRIAWLLPVAIGVTAYGASYLFVHEVYIHRRLPVRLPPNRYLERLSQAHALHHRFGGEPYGMLAPVVPRSVRERQDARPDSARPMRSRL